MLLFNLVGYQLVIDFLQHRQTAILTARLDKEAYAEADLISIKTPIALPYYTNSAEYERIDGTIEMDGVAYHYVKRRVYNDSLLCSVGPAAPQTLPASWFETRSSPYLPYRI